jgi:hypothetical protein
MILTLERPCRTVALTSESSAVSRYEFAAEGHAVIQYVYLVILRCLWDVVRREWLAMWTAGSWLLPHVNALAHTAWPIGKLSAKHSLHTLPQSPPPIRVSSPLQISLFSLNSNLLLQRDFRQCKTSPLKPWLTGKGYHKYPSNSVSESRDVYGCARGLLRGDNIQ